LPRARSGAGDRYRPTVGLSGRSENIVVPLVPPHEPSADLAEDFDHLVRSLCRAVDIPPELQGELRRFGTRISTASPTLAGATAAQIDASQRAGFLVSLAHDLRAPIGALMHQSQLLAQDGLTAELRGRSMKAMETNAAHLEELLETLADIERLTLGEFEVRLEATNLSALLRGVVSEDLEGGIDLRLPDEDVEVLLDPVIVRRVVRTVLGALHRNVGRWAMSLEATGDDVVVRARPERAAVVDAGAGDRAGVNLDAAVQLAVALVELHRGRVTFGLHEGLPSVEITLPVTAAPDPRA
jgi:hypothetical protein